MSRRKQPTQKQVLDVMRLMADIAAHRQQPNTQRKLLIDGMVRLIGAPVGFSYICDGWRPHLEPRFVHATFMHETEEVFTHYANHVLIPHTVRADPYCDLALDRTATIDQLTQNRALPDPAAMEKYAPFTHWSFMTRLRDGAVNWARIDEQKDGAMLGFALHRLDDDLPFSPADRRLMRLATAELRRLALRGWFALPEFAGPLAEQARRLTPRLRQVLGLMLAGRHLKGIAHDLGLSVHTVRDYTKELYRRFDVAGREELMALFVGPPTNHAPHDEPPTVN